MHISMVEKPEYPIVSAGLDWVTTFNQEKFNTVMSTDYMWTVQEELKRRGHAITRSTRMGYVGCQSEGFFMGDNENRTLAILTSDLAREFGVGLIKVSQKISRIDLQVTVDTCAERPCLSLDAYHFAIQGEHRRGRPREYKLTRTHPAGDTLNVNKRTSDSYGRLYDWGAAHKQEEKHRYWRYEVETKRNYCARIASTLRSSVCAETLSRGLVFDWFRERLFTPAFSPRGSLRSLNLPLVAVKPGLIAWLDSSVSVSVRRAINIYGLPNVLDALKLSPLVDIKPERREENG
jgi:hypothetical protein